MREGEREGGGREQENWIIKVRMSEMVRIEFGVHELKGHSTSFPGTCPTEIFAQGGQSDIYKNVQHIMYIIKA